MGENYKTYYSTLKKDKAKLNRAIVQHRVNNQGKKKRQLDAQAFRLTQTKGKTKVHRRIAKRRKFTFDAFKDHYEQKKNGGLSESQCRDRWSKGTSDVKPADHKGTVQGVKGHPRWRFDLTGSESQSESLDYDGCRVC